MTAPLAIFGLDVGELVEDAVRALVDLVVPDFGAQWVSSLVTWLVALPPVTSDAFPSLNDYAEQLTAVGYGLLGACFLGGLLQLWAGGASGATGAEAVRRAAIGAGALASYTTVLQALLVGVNVLTAEMIRHPLVVDGLDKAFGESLVVAAVTGGVTLGLAIGAAVVLLYFVAALFVLKIGLTAMLAVAVVAGALVWGLYPLPQAQWLARTWASCVAAALAVPVAWACIFAAAALLARDTLVFDNGGQFNQPLGDALGYLVKPFAAVACFWIAYRAPYFLLGLARTAGITPAMVRGGGAGSGAGRAAGRAGMQRGPQSAGDRFRAFFAAAPSRVRTHTRARPRAAALVSRRASVQRGTGPAGAAQRSQATAKKTSSADRSRAPSGASKPRAVRDGSQRAPGPGASGRDGSRASDGVVRSKPAVGKKPGLASARPAQGETPTASPRGGSGTERSSSRKKPASRTTSTLAGTPQRGARTTSTRADPPSGRTDRSPGPDAGSRPGATRPPAPRPAPHKSPPKKPPSSA